MFTGGVMHIIDTVLTIPLSPAMSAIDSNLLSLAGALKTTSLIDPVDSIKDVTIFAPSNEAFEKIGNTAAALPVTQLSEILKYHVINGTVRFIPFFLPIPLLDYVTKLTNPLSGRILYFPCHRSR